MLPGMALHLHGSRWIQRKRTACRCLTQRVPLLGVRSAAAAKAAWPGMKDANVQVIGRSCIPARVVTCSKQGLTRGA